MELTICFQISWPGYRIWCLKGKEVHEDFPSLQHSGQIIIIWGWSLGCCNTWGLTIQIKFLLFENKQFIQTQSICSRLRSSRFFFFFASVFSHSFHPSPSLPGDRGGHRNHSQVPTGASAVLVSGPVTGGETLHPELEEYDRCLQDSAYAPLTYPRSSLQRVSLPSQLASLCLRLLSVLKWGRAVTLWN